MGQVTTVMAQTVESSDIVLGSSCAGLHFGLLVVALKGVASIDPLVITVGLDQLNYGTQPKGAMISRRED
jgi:Na+/melibiose symporter-like transporter